MESRSTKVQSITDLLMKARSYATIGDGYNVPHLYGPTPFSTSDLKARITSDTLTYLS